MLKSEVGILCINRLTSTCICRVESGLNTENLNLRKLHFTYHGITILTWKIHNTVKLSAVPDLLSLCQKSWVFLAYRLLEWHPSPYLLSYALNILVVHAILPPISCSVFLCCIVDDTVYICTPLWGTFRNDFVVVTSTKMLFIVRSVMMHHDVKNISWNDFKL